jgi:hypothetical protein
LFYFLRLFFLDNCKNILIIGASIHTFLGIVRDVLGFELKSLLEDLKLLQEGEDLRLDSSEHGLSFLDEALVLSFE